jgi:hypothetical protein
MQSAPWALFLPRGNRADVKSELRDPRQTKKQEAPHLVLRGTEPIDVAKRSVRVLNSQELLEVGVVAK